MKDKCIVLGVTGSIAVYKAVEIASWFSQRKVKVITVLTSSATKFVSPLTFETITGIPSITTLFDNKKFARVQHISIADQTHVLLVAPATANIIGKFANGIADDFLTTFFLSLSPNIPIIIAPAMNPNMYAHPIVQENIKKLKKYGCHFISPAKGHLACGKKGIGRLQDINIIIKQTCKFLKINVK